MRNFPLLIAALLFLSLGFTACQNEEDYLSIGDVGSSPANNVIMFNYEGLPVLSDSSLFDFTPFDGSLLKDRTASISQNKSIKDDILSDKWRYYQNVPILDGGYAMVGSFVYNTFIIGDQRWFLQDFRDAGLVKSCPNTWEQTVFGEQPSDFVKDTAKYFYFDATFLANGLTSTIDFNAPSGLNPTTAWKLPNDYDMRHLWCMLDYSQAKMAEIFYGDEHKGILIAEYDANADPPRMIEKGVIHPEYSFFWIENDNPKVHYTLYGFKGKEGICGYFNPGSLPPNYLYAPFRLMQYVTPIDTIPQN